MRRFTVLFAIVVLWSLPLSGADDPGRSFLVKDGEPTSTIVIAANPTRTQKLAAVELQTYLKKLSGAHVPIQDEPSNEGVNVFVGQSQHTEQLGVTAKGLRHGAFRIKSGESWLALIGDDTDFVPIEPWPRGHSDIRSGKMQTEWNKITGRQWGYMHRQLHKHYSGPNSLFGTPNERKTDEEGNVHVWTFDERGSFNAVCEFLRQHGVRWYMPGEIGEIVPPRKTIELIRHDQVIRPDFPLRVLNFRPSVYGRDVMMWGFRLGVRQPYGRQAAHGLHSMTDNESTLKNHPDWFALYGNKRHNQSNVKCNQLCYSNDELFKEAVEFARAQLDHFDMDVVSIMPPDGYTAICQCSKCDGKESPELGPRGRLSNYVWDFVNRVASEVRKTHPNKRISNCAYGVYTEPPSNIEKLEPNLQVIIVGGRRPTSEDREDLRRLWREWNAKTDHPIEIFENYPFTGRGYYLPAFIPHVLGESINETKGHSRGEDVWLTMDFSEKAVGFNHFLAYFTARMYWGGPDKDVGAMFHEYVTKFYGPAAEPMMLFFRHCEQHWRSMDKDSEAANKALELFSNAKERVSAESIYGKRLALIDQYLNGLRSKAQQLAQKRGPVPKLRLVSGVQQRGTITVDGKLDDGPWVKIPSSSTGVLRELQTGRAPTFGTKVMAEWIGSDLYFAIRCEERAGEKPNNTATEDGDPAIWYGDVVEIEIATDAHSYYQMAISPSGALVDADRAAPKTGWFKWSSKAEVATQLHGDHWVVEIRIPTTQDANDPLHQLIGRKPTQSLPWHINVCRQRVRDTGTELSALSPTGSQSFHDPMKFAHFYAGRSHAFESDSSVTDYVLKRKAAESFVRARKWRPALSAFENLAQGNVTEYQKSDALANAGSSAIRLREFAEVKRLSQQIPIESVAKTLRMRGLAAQQKWAEIISDYGSEDFETWPFWQIGEAAFVRGRAFYATKKFDSAEDDLTLALAYQPDRRICVDIRTMLATNREQNGNDRAGALSLYQANLAGKTKIGAANEFRSLQRAAMILMDQGDHANALAMFEIVDFEKLQGFWLQEMRITKAQVLLAGENSGEARNQAFGLLRDVNESPAASKQQKELARQLLE